uniref:Uncharacterized protein n=1 Tax=Amphimedon queenslandica TaxID=400682 RepID=A0A1X7UAW3_AMPQE
MVLMLMVLVSLGDHLVNMYGPLHLDPLTLVMKRVLPVIALMAINYSLVITFVNQVITKKIMMPKIFSTHLIHSGMVKVVGLLKFLVVQLQVSHGFTETMVTIPALTILS